MQRSRLRFPVLLLLLSLLSLLCLSASLFAAPLADSQPADAMEDPLILPTNEPILLTAETANQPIISGYLLIEPPAAALDLSEVRVSPLNIRINDEAIDHRDSLYPLLSYRGITYFPLTWDYCRALNCSVSFSETEGLRISRGSRFSTNRSFTLPGLPEGQLPLEAETRVTAQLPGFAIALECDDDYTPEFPADWPFLVYNDITYLPFTWDYAHLCLELDFEFHMASSSLLISTANAVPPVSKPRQDQPVPTTQGHSRAALPTLSGGHTMTMQEAGKLGALMSRAPQNELPDVIAFTAELNVQFDDSYATETQRIQSHLECVLDIAAERLIATLTFQDQEDVDFHVPATQFYLRPLAEGEGMQLFSHEKGLLWDQYPDDSIPFNPFRSFKNAASQSARTESDAALGEDQLELLERFGLSHLIDQEAMSKITLELLARLDYAESSIDGREIISVSYSGTITELLDILSLDLNQLVLGILPELSQQSALTPQESQEYAESLQASLQPLLDTAIYCAIDYDAESALPQRMHMAFIFEASALDATDEAQLVGDIVLNYSYEDDSSLPKQADFSMSIQLQDDDANYSALIDLLYTYDYDTEFDWDALDAEVQNSDSLTTP